MQTVLKVHRCIRPSTANQPAIRFALINRIVRCSNIEVVNSNGAQKERAQACVCNSQVKGSTSVGESSALQTTPEVGAHDKKALWRTVLGLAGRCAAMFAFCIVWHCMLIPAAHAAASSTSSNAISGLLSFVLHLDHHLSSMIEQHGRTTYAILFAIVFCETGLVLTPFLPGDSLLFAAGAFAGMGKLDLATLMAVFLVSAILGDAVNYTIGNTLGSWAVSKGIVKQEYIKKTEKFYDKYGGKTVVLARFVPIIRTFAPFVAGVGSMPYSRFALYNVLGAVIWSVLFVGGGFFFGNLPFVQKNFTLVVLAIVAVSVVPVIIEIISARRESESEGKGGAAA